MEDAALLRKIKKGNTGALEALIRRYTPYVSACAYRATGSLPREDLEEVVSDTFVALWQHAGELDGSTLRGWLGTVAGNKAKNRLRSYARSGMSSAPIPEDAPAPDDPARQTEEQEVSALLWQAVDSLDEPERTLFLRYYYEGEKLKTIAAELGLNPATAKTKLRRGRQLLRARLQGKEGVGFG